MHRPSRTVLTLVLAATVLGCASHETIMIPRYDSGEVRDEPYAGACYEVEREVDGRNYALRAVAFDTTLCLGARADGDFVGQVVWRAGDLQLSLALDGESPDRGIPVTVTAAGPDAGVAAADGPTARVLRAGPSTTVVIEIPIGVLRGGDGTLVLELVPAQREPVRIPATGRLRGVYLRV